MIKLVEQQYKALICSFFKTSLPTIETIQRDDCFGDAITQSMPCSARVISQLWPGHHISTSMLMMHRLWTS